MGASTRSRVPEVKICGLTRVEDVRLAERAGASYVGAILVPDTPRCVSPGEAGVLARAVGIPLVAVVADLAADAAARAADAAGARAIQLHGSESPGVVEALRGRGGWELWKAVRVRDRDDIVRALGRFGGLVDLLLLDAWSERALGGTGTRFPWESWDRGRAGLDNALRIGVAGGLSPDNVEEAVGRLAPDLVDVGSGVELRPGVKDPDRIEAFIARALSGAARAGSVSGTAAAADESSAEREA